MMKFMQRPLAWLLSAMLVLMPMMSAQAAMISTDQIIDHADSSLTQERLKQFLDQEVAQQQLLALGVSPDWVKGRVNNLTDRELARINQGIDKLNAGGDVLGVLLIIFIVFVITDVIGATNIFPFIHPVK